MFKLAVDSHRATLRACVGADGAAAPVRRARCRDNQRNHHLRCQRLYLQLYMSLNSSCIYV